MRKGSQMTQESKDKLSKAKKGKPSPNKGKKFSDEWRKNLSISHMGIKPSKKALEVLLFHSKGENHGMWKGNKVGYSSLHKWVRRILGRPKICSYCNEPEKIVKRTNIFWANISHKYRRDPTDWIALCASCNLQYDYGHIKIDHIIPFLKDSEKR